MHKALIVARAEYINAIMSKAFILGLIMMPIFMGGGIIVQALTRDQIDLTDRTLAIVDRTGQLYPAIEAAAKLRNDQQIHEGEGAARKQMRPKYVLEEFKPDPAAESRPDVPLSQRVRDKNLFAFAILGPELTASAPSGGAVVYHTETPSYQELPEWLGTVVNAELQRRRLVDEGIDPALLAKLNAQAPVRRLGLVEVGANNQVIEAKEEGLLQTLAVPFGGMIMLFMLVMMVAPAMLNSVLEEKMQKIAEFLVSSVTPFQLMMGKLIGSVMVSLTLALVYLGAVFFTTRHFGVESLVPLSAYLWFILFMLLALVIYGSIFSALGAACSELRDAQSLMTPVMLMIMIPMFCIGPILESPTSAFSRIISLFPPATPMLMFMRICIPPGPPWWEVVLGVVLAAAFAAGCVWAAGKVFRIGILLQGQPATLGRIAKWIVTPS